MILLLGLPVVLLALVASGNFMFWYEVRTGDGVHTNRPSYRWAQAVNKECAHRNEQAAVVPRPRTFGGVAAFADRLALVTALFAERVSALPAPKDRPDAARLLAGVNAAAVLGFKVLGDAARSGNRSRVAVAERRFSLYARDVNPKLAGLGLTDCVLPRSGMP